MSFHFQLPLDQIVPELLKMKELSSLRMALGLIKFTRSELFRLSSIKSVKNLHIDLYSPVDEFGYMVDFIFPNIAQIIIQCDCEDVFTWAHANIPRSMYKAFKEEKVQQPFSMCLIRQ